MTHTPKSNLATMKADEARELAKAAKTANIEDIYKTIRLYAEKGDYECHYYAPIPPEILVILEEDGYRVTTVSEQPEYVVNISWTSKQ